MKGVFMSRKNVVMLMVVGVLLASIVLPLAFAEDAQPPRRPQARQSGGQQGRPQGGQPGQRGGQRGGFDFQARMNEMLKEELAASDSEWKVIEPRLTKVTTLQRDSSRGGMGMMGMMMGRMRSSRPGQEGQQRPNRPTRPGQPAGTQTEQSDVQKATEALSQVLEKKDAPADEINAKLLVLRKAREKSKQELAKAQKALKDVLTVRQEAKLVLYGMLN